MLECLVANFDEKARVGLAIVAQKQNISREALEKVWTNKDATGPGGEHSRKACPGQSTAYPLSSARDECIPLHKRAQQWLVLT